jgi:hypothetical protein
MDISDHFFGIFFIIIGAFSALTGFRILHPFKNNTEIQKRISNNINLYRIGGIGLIVYGFIKILE